LNLNDIALGHKEVWLIRDICNVLAAMGSTSIDLYEWHRASVELPRLPPNSLWSTHAVSAGSVAFRGISLAHAVAKADYLIVRNYALPSLGFLLQMDQIIDFGSSSNLRLLSGAPAILNDVTQSSLIGRVGQGLALMFAESRGYPFVGHLASDPAVISHLSSSDGGRVADFLIENASGERIIVESKATFSLAENKCSPIKSVLRKALVEQVDPWLSIVSPSPANGYAVYSCLREAGGATPSAISFVDPPERKGGFQIELPESWVRRHNYAAWLRFMGLRSAANRLREGGKVPEDGKEPRPERFRRLNLYEREFLVLTSHERPDSFPDKRFAIGMERSALKMVGATIQGSPEALLDYVPQPIQLEGASAPLSILSDGTLLGLVDVANLDGTEDVLL
jgi:hypothetical protein